MALDLFYEERFYLKYNNTLLGIIDNDGVKLIEGNITNEIRIILGSSHYLSRHSLDKILEDRIFSKYRKDLNKILALLDIVSYDVLSIAKKTRAFNLTDKLWIAYDENEDYETTFRYVFMELYNNKLFSKNASLVTSPTGINIKSYMFKSGMFGIKKKRLNNHSYDIVNEVVCYRLATLLNIRCCNYEMLTEEYVYSKYIYEPFKDVFIHARAVIDTIPDVDNYSYILDSLKTNYDVSVFDMLHLYKMFVFDFITNQDDRHLSNYAFLIQDNRKLEAYPLYDNGRCLFYDQDEEFIEEAVENISMYSNSFGLVGSHYDLILDLLENKNEIFSEWTELKSLDYTDVFKIFEGLNIPDNRVKLCSKWIMECINILCV